jgi:hypothetical protein
MTTRLRSALGMLAAWSVYFASRGWLFHRALSDALTTIRSVKLIVAGGPNLAVYAYFADIVSTGRDPYALTSGPIKPSYADYPPFLMAVFGSLATLMTGRLAVLIVCFLGDLVLWSLTLRLASTRSRLDKLFTLALVLVNPVYLETELSEVQYKPWIIAGFVALYMTRSAVVLGALSGAFVLPSLLIPERFHRDRDWRALGTAIVVAALMWLPFVRTAAAAVFLRRSDRAAMVAHGDGVMVGMPVGAQTTFLAIGIALVIACLVVRRNLVLQGAAALAVLVMLSTEVSLNRVLAFTLPVLIAAPMSGYARASVFVACAISYASFEWRWSSDSIFATPSALAFVGMYLPTAIALLIAYTSTEDRGVA